MDSNNRTKMSNSRMINIFRKMLSEKWHAMIGPDRKDGGEGIEGGGSREKKEREKNRGWGTKKKSSIRRAFRRRILWMTDR